MLACNARFVPSMAVENSIFRGDVPVRPRQNGLKPRPEPPEHGGGHSMSVAWP
jgi:hypothetical protein